MQELRSQLEAEKTRGEEIWEELSDTEQALAEVRSENLELRSQLEQKRASREEVEAELARLAADREDLAQLKKQVKEHALEVHREGRSIELEKDRWQGQLSEARADLAAAQATIVFQKGKILELERGYSLKKPNPAESRLRLEIGELQAQLSELKQKSAAASELPEAADLLNQLKSYRKKSSATLADVEKILEILEGI